MKQLDLMKNRLPSRAYFTSDQERVVSLDGKWRFRYFDAPARIPETIDKWDEITVPSSWQLHGYDQMHYTDLYYQFPLIPPYVPAKNPTGVYERDLLVTAEDLVSDFEHRLRFHGVDSHFSLWINDSYIGETTGSRYTSEFDVTAHLHEGLNTLRVIVSKWSVGTFLEDQDMWWLSGIFRSVAWIKLPVERIENYRFIVNFLNHYMAATLDFIVDLAGAGDVQLSVGLLDDKGMCCASTNQTIQGGVNSHAISLSLALQNPKLWTAETPYLYDLEISIKRDGRILHEVKDRIGLREVRVMGQEIQINGKPIRFKGVNRHDFNCDTGRTVSIEDMRYDLELMKKSNMNAVRTAHYPNAPEFYAMCDEIGLYVISEADMECHGFELINRYDWLTDDALWTPAYVDRAERLVLRDINRPSIIMWSLGNESEFGRNFVAMAEAIRKLDSTRLVHYEGDRDVEVSDVYSTMYTRFERLEEIGKSIDGTKPHLLCEYAHAMGNGPGGLLDYQMLFRKYPRLHGGFIWEWIDHGIRSYDVSGKVFYKYGGDYGDAPHNGNFNCDGLLFPDRTPSPALYEVKSVFSPIWIERFEHHDRSELNDDFIGLKLFNDYDHLNLDHVCFEWKAEGIVQRFKITGLDARKACRLLVKGQAKVLALHETPSVKLIALSAEEWEAIMPQTSEASKEMPCAFDGGVLTAYDMRSGNRLMQHQILDLPHQKEETQKMDGHASVGGLVVDETHDTLNVRTLSGERQLIFDKVDGVLMQYRLEGTDLLKKGPQMNFWRAPIDNDMYVLKDWKDKYALHLGQLYPETFEWTQAPDRGEVTIKSRAIFGSPNQVWHYILETTITVHTDARLTFRFTGKFKDPKRFFQTTLPKIGSLSVLAESPNQITYHGLGPYENYPDSQFSALQGVYSATSADLFTNYPYPQDNGNRGGVSAVALDFDRTQLKIDFHQSSNFAYRPYSDRMLMEAGHMNALYEEGCFLHLDYKVNGLGSNSCGPEPTPENKLKPVDFDFGYTWELIRKG